MIRIAVLGTKGGSGKTLLSHILCHGLGLRGIPAYHFTTDQGRQVLSNAGRCYAVVDGTELEKLTRILEMLAPRDGVAVIDGGANQGDSDKRLARLADMVLIPFQASAEDLRVSKSDLERLPAALGVPMRWPSNLWQRTFADRLMNQHLDAARTRITVPIVVRGALQTLLSDEPPDSRINAVCRDIAADILRLSGFVIETTAE